MAPRCPSPAAELLPLHPSSNPAAGRSRARGQVASGTPWHLPFLCPAKHPPRRGHSSGSSAVLQASFTVRTCCAQSAWPREQHPGQGGQSQSSTPGTHRAELRLQLPGLAEELQPLQAAVGLRHQVMELLLQLAVEPLGQLRAAPGGGEQSGRQCWVLLTPAGASRVGSTVGMSSVEAGTGAWLCGQPGSRQAVTQDVWLVRARVVSRPGASEETFTTSSEPTWGPRAVAVVCWAPSMGMLHPGPGVAGHLLVPWSKRAAWHSWAQGAAGAVLCVHGRLQRGGSTRQEQRSRTSVA